MTLPESIKNQVQAIADSWKCVGFEPLAENINLVSKVATEEPPVVVPVADVLVPSLNSGKIHPGDVAAAEEISTFGAVSLGPCCYPRLARNVVLPSPTRVLPGSHQGSQEVRVFPMNFPRVC